MSRTFFEQSLQAIDEPLMRMGCLLKQMIAESVESFKKQDAVLAQKVIDSDVTINALEMQIQTECFDLLALQQPVASDLRKIQTALKMIADLERMADHAAGIAKATIRLKDEKLMKPLVDIPRMAEISIQMLEDSLKAYNKKDTDVVYAMVERDHDIDSLYKQIFRELLTYIMEDPKTINQAMQLLLVAQRLERIGDHATNLGEWIIYMVTGEKRTLNN